MPPSTAALRPAPGSSGRQARMRRGGPKTSRAAAGVDRWAGSKLPGTDEFGLPTLGSERLLTTARQI